MKTVRHFMYVPMTGLGLYGGHRGGRWLRNRIKILKQFVVPSLHAQTNQNFTVWMSARREDVRDKDILALKDYMEQEFPGRFVLTFSGVCFWDDKYTDAEAHERLAMALHSAITRELADATGDVDEVLMTIQPSDDLYNRYHVENIQKLFAETDYQAIGYTKGYLCNYRTLETLEYNPKTNPPFFTIRFPKDVFMDPFLHLDYTGPYKSHEYVGDHLKYLRLDQRGFMVGTHGENISTHFNHPYGGEKVANIRDEFGIGLAEPLKIRYSWRKALMRKLPHGWQRKLRYIFGERFFARVYKFLRN